MSDTVPQLRFLMRVDHYWNYESRDDDEQCQSVYKRTPVLQFFDTDKQQWMSVPTVQEHHHIGRGK